MSEIYWGEKQVNSVPRPSARLLKPETASFPAIKAIFESGHGVCGQAVQPPTIPTRGYPQEASLEHSLGRGLASEKFFS